MTKTKIRLLKEIGLIAVIGIIFFFLTGQERTEIYDIFAGLFLIFSLMRVIEKDRDFISGIIFYTVVGLTLVVLHIITNPELNIQVYIFGRVLSLIFVSVVMILLKKLEKRTLDNKDKDE